MTTQSQQQMAQPETAQAGDRGTTVPAEGRAFEGFVGAACGAGAGAAMIWQPVTMIAGNRPSGAR